MAFAVFEVPAQHVAKANEVLADDQVSRLTIVVKDGKAYGFAEGSQVVFVEGEEEKVKRAEQLFSPIASKAKEPERFKARLKAEDDEAASGVGFIFG